MVLRLRPELVRMGAARGASIPFGSAFYYPDFSDVSRVDVPRAFDGLSERGLWDDQRSPRPRKARPCSRRRR